MLRRELVRGKAVNCCIKLHLCPTRIFKSADVSGLSIRATTEEMSRRDTRRSYHNQLDTFPEQLSHYCPQTIAKRVRDVLHGLEIKEKRVVSKWRASSITLDHWLC